MIEVFTVVFVGSEGMEAKMITPADYEIRNGTNRVYSYNKKVRTYTKLSQARVYRRRLDSTQPRTDGLYRIAFLRINDDGSLECGWAD